VKDSFSYTIWTLRIHGNAIWAHQRLDNMSRNDQRCTTTIFEHICHSIPERHHDILNHVGETCAACFPSIEMFEKKRSTPQTKEMRISSKGS